MVKNRMIALFRAVVLVLLAAHSAAGAENESGLKKWLQLNEGLTNNYIMSLSQDRYGGMWIGTEEGMNRFDGVSIRNYMKSSGILSGNEINKVLPDRFSDKVWVATQRAGISVYDYSDGSAGFLRHSCDAPVSLPSDEVTDIEQDDRGRIWFTTYTKGVGCYDPDTEDITLYDHENVEGLAGSSFRAIELGIDGKVYLASYGGGIAVMDPITRTAVRYRHEPDDPCSLPSNEIGCMYKDGDGNIWVGTRHGLALYRSVSMDFQVFNYGNTGLPDGFIMSVLVTSDKKLLVSPGYNGLWVMDISAGVSGQNFKRFQDVEELENSSVRSMFEDDFGNLWIGSYGHGILFYGKNSPGFMVYSDMPENSVTSLDFSPSGKLLAGTDGGGINVIDADFNVVDISHGKNFDRSIFSICHDSSGNIWVGSFNGPTIVTDPLLNHKAELQIPEVRDFYEQDGFMWVVSGYRGLYLLDLRTFKELHRYSAPDYFPDNYLRNISIDKKGNIWLGTLRSGLFVYDSEMNRIASYNTDSGFPSNTVNHLMLDRKGNIWAATAEGLVCFNDGDEIDYFKVEFNEEGSENVKAVIEDKNGMIWFSTSVSVCWFDPDELKVKRYDHRNGLADGNYAPAAVAIDNEGKLYFGSTKGISIIHPEEVYSGRHSPSLHFSEMNIFDADDPLGNRNETIILAGREEMKLKHGQNNFTVSFAVDDHGISDYVEYSYKVEGRDVNWYPVDRHNEVVFRQLDPGSYTLMVRARMINEEWDGRIISLRISVTPPVYASKVAWTIYLLFLLFILAMFLYLYKQKLSHDNELKLEKETLARIKEVNEERLRFYTNITHELRTPLTLIIGPLEDLKNDFSLSGHVRQKLSVILRNSNILMELINKLLDFRKAETHNVQLKPIYADLSKTVEDVGHIFSEANTNRNVEIVFEVERGVMTRFDPEVFATILRNLLSNAMKYTSSGYVKISLNTVETDGVNYACLSVEDSGSGISKENLEKIFDRYYQVAGQAQGTGIGLALVKKYVKLHGGRVSVESEVGKGSVFTVRIPMLPPEEEEPYSAVNEIIPNENTAKRPQIVVVDDNDEIRKYVKGSLIDRYDIYTASNGADGLKLVVKHIPDLVISDIMMPVMDGIQLCANIKKDLNLSHIPVILLTAKNTIEDRSEGYEVGADSYIPKPFTSGMLRARVSNLLDARRKIMDQFAAAIPEDKEMEVAQNNYAVIDNEYLKRITELIEENISSENLDVSWLADKMNMSPSTLYRKLKGLVGISANEYIRKIKMRKAAEMLASGSYNVSETSWNVGISSMIYFRQCFKEEYGVSPSEYRKSHLSK